MGSLLDIQGLKVSYNKNKKQNIILKGIDLKLEKGEIVVIVGESGSGKTTLIRSIIKLLGKNSQILDGTINFRNKQNLLNLSDKEILKIRGTEIGMVFQNPKYHLTQLLKIKKQFLEILKKHKNLDSKKGLEVAISYLEKLNIKDATRVLNSYPFQLSGGLLQRVYISMVMSMEPSILLADEPTSALDASSQKKLANNFLEIKKEGNIGTIIVTHDLELALYLADHIIVMKDGLIVEKTTVEKINSGERHEYTNSLFNAIPTLEEFANER